MIEFYTATSALFCPFDHYLLSFQNFLFSFFLQGLWHMLTFSCVILQVIFGILYIINLAIVMFIYLKTDVVHKPSLKFYVCF